MYQNKIGICEWSLPEPLRGPACCRVLHDFGLQGVELELRTAEEHFPLANPYVISLYLEEKARWNVAFTGVAANLTNFFPMTAPESDPKRQIAEAGVKKVIDAAAALGAPLIHAPSFNDSLIETAADLANTAHFMQKMCDYAADRNILVCTENCLDTARHPELLAHVNRKNFKVYFDAQNYDTMAHLYTPELIDPIAEQIVEIHLKDGSDQLSSHRIGEGRCAVFQTMERLLANGYQGWFMLENYYSQSPLCSEDGDFCTPLREDIAIVQRWLETH